MVENVKAEEINYLFPKSLLGATIQDGGIKKEEMCGVRVVNDGLSFYLFSFSSSFHFLYFLLFYLGFFTFLYLRLR